MAATQGTPGGVPLTRYGAVLESLLDREAAITGSGERNLTNAQLNADASSLTARAKRAQTNTASTVAGDVTKSSPFGIDFSSVTDFLNFASWLLHPLNWLRFAEFVMGIGLTAIGIALLTQRSGGGVTARRIISMTPAGAARNRMRGRGEARTQRQVNEGRQQWKASNP